MTHAIIAVNSIITTSRRKRLSSLGNKSKIFVPASLIIEDAVYI